MSKPRWSLKNDPATSSERRHLTSSAVLRAPPPLVCLLPLCCQARLCVGLPPLLLGCSCLLRPLAILVGGRGTGACVRMRAARAASCLGPPTVQGPQLRLQHSTPTMLASAGPGCTRHAPARLTQGPHMLTQPLQPTASARHRHLLPPPPPTRRSSTNRRNSSSRSSGPSAAPAGCAATSAAMGVQRVSPSTPRERSSWWYAATRACWAACGQIARGGRDGGQGGHEGGEPAAHEGCK
jgi:hypothetical protein